MANADVLPADVVTVELAYSPSAGAVEREPLQLPAGARVADALRHSAIVQRHPALQAVLSTAEAPVAIGVWGRRCSIEQPLRDGDRVEVYRPLQVDPKDARRERQRRQQMRSGAGASGRGATRTGQAAAGGEPAGPPVKGSPNR